MSEIYKPTTQELANPHYHQSAADKPFWQRLPWSVTPTGADPRNEPKGSQPEPQAPELEPRETRHKNR